MKRGHNLTAIKVTVINKRFMSYRYLINGVMDVMLCCHGNISSGDKENIITVSLIWSLHQVCSKRSHSEAIVSSRILELCPSEVNRA